MQQLEPDLPMAQCQGPRAQTVSLFLWFVFFFWSSPKFQQKMIQIF